MLSLAKSLRLRGGMKTFHKALYYCCRELFGYTQEEFNARWSPRNSQTTDTLRGYTQPKAELLEETWLKTRDANWLYSHPEYKFDSLGVSTFQTSATTTNGISLLNKREIKPKRIIDWGAGPGFSTIILARNFPNAVVHYNEINKDLVSIFNWFTSHAKIKNVKHVPVITEEYDLVQAYEIVEHLPHKEYEKVGDPLTETLQLLKNSKATHFLHSTCWTAENKYMTLGHFQHYEIDNEFHQVGRAGNAFKKALLKRNWKLLGTGWNARPHLFSR